MNARPFCTFAHLLRSQRIVSRCPPDCLKFRIGVDLEGGKLSNEQNKSLDVEIEKSSKQ